MKQRFLILSLVLLGGVAGYFRLVELDRAAVRSDEINFLNIAQGQQTIAGLWKNPPWQNQIPLADSIPVIWRSIRPGAVDEGVVREPFALIGIATVVGVAWWTMRRRGVWAGSIAGLWMALLPFHLYQSREAYYYVVVMAASAGLTLYSVDLLLRLWRGELLRWTSLFIWTAWAVTTCLTHMATWVVAGLLWALLLGAGWLMCPKDRRLMLLGQFAASAGIIAVFMIRWIFRAVVEMQKVSQADGHLGGAFGWVGPRVLPFFTVGANLAGYIATALVLVAGLAVIAQSARRRWADADDRRLGALSVVTFTGFVAAYAYIGGVGGGAAKIAYFTTLLPIWIVWGSWSSDRLLACLPARLAPVGRIGLLVVIGFVLTVPAWMVTRLDGKPVPYKTLRAWMDGELEAGSVVVVDRWFEPWNEMARYAPTNVTVTFTVPDEPYENYRQLRWREVTQAAIESGQVQAFMRLTRNHEARDGLWMWPETYFTRRAVVKNEAGLWLREHGYAANEDFYAANTNRLIAEIFYDTREDRLARARREGKSFEVLFGRGMPYEKSGPMGIFRFQTPNFMDWRVLEQRGQMEIHNLTDAPVDVQLRVAAISPRGPKLVSGPGGMKTQFAGTNVQRWLTPAIRLAPGPQTITLEDPLWDRAMNPLLIAQVDIVPAGTAPAP